MTEVDQLLLAASTTVNIYTCILLCYSRSKVWCMVKQRKYFSCLYIRAYLSSSSTTCHSSDLSVTHTHTPTPYQATQVWRLCKQLIPGADQMLLLWQTLCYISTFQYIINLLLLIIWKGRNWAAELNTHSNICCLIRTVWKP